MNRSTTVWAASAGIVMVLAAIAGWYRPLDAATASEAVRAAAWRLPTAAELERSSAALSAAADGVDWVGEGGGGGPTVQWQLLGLVGRYDERAVLGRVGSDPLIKRFRSGDILPDGSTLVRVGTDGIVIDRDGCQIRRPLYATVKGSESTQAAGGACVPPGTD